MRWFGTDWKTNVKKKRKDFFPIHGKINKGGTIAMRA